jgi:hypothetical protein
MERNEGHIVIYPFCILVDELFLIQGTEKIAHSASLSPDDDERQTIRLGLERYDSESGMIRGHFDLLVPRHIAAQPLGMQNAIALLNLPNSDRWPTNDSHLYST